MRGFAPQCCCPGGGWFDCYWPGPLATNEPRMTHARTTNQGGTPISDWSHNATPSWSVTLSYPLRETLPINDAFRTLAASADPSIERVWLWYRTDGYIYVDPNGNTNNDIEDVALVLVDVGQELVLQEWRGSDHTYVVSNVTTTKLPVPRGANISLPYSRSVGGNVEPVDAPRGLLNDLHPLAAYGITYPVAGEDTIGRIYATVDLPARGDETSLLMQWGQANPVEAPITDFYSTYTGGSDTDVKWSDNAWPHAGTVRSHPKCAGMRTVWNALSYTYTGEQTVGPFTYHSYDIDWDVSIQIVRGEFQGNLFTMDVDEVLKQWDGTGSLTNEPVIPLSVKYPTGAEPSDDDVIDCIKSYVARVVNDTFPANSRISAYAENKGGDYLLLYHDHLDAVGVSRLVFNGTEIYYDVNNVTLFDDGTLGGDISGLHFIDALLLDPIANDPPLPDDTGKRGRALVQFGHPTTGAQYVQLVDENWVPVWTCPVSPAVLVNGCSDVYAYVLHDLPGLPSLYMARMDGAFHKLKPAGEPSSKSIEEIKDIVKISGIDSLGRPPLEENAPDW